MATSCQSVKGIGDRNIPFNPAELMHHGYFQLSERLPAKSYLLWADAVLCDMGSNLVNFVSGEVRLIIADIAAKVCF